VKTPVAVNCCVNPFAMLGVAGDTSMDTSVASVTAKTVLPLTSPLEADKVVLPPPAAVARPFEPAALLTVATAVLEEDQVTWSVRSWVELSVKTPVAVNCCVNPLAMLGIAGDTSMDASVASVTVKFVLPFTPPFVAVTVVLPMPAAVARPFELASLLTVATASSDEAQVTCPVMSWVELSVKTPVAVNCVLVPAAAVGTLGVTSIDRSVGVPAGGGIAVMLPPPLLRPPPSSQPARTPRTPSIATQAISRTVLQHM
jgi:hypothetical protein